MSWAPEAGFGTGITLMDSETLYQLSYPGAVRKVYRGVVTPARCH